MIRRLIPLLVLILVPQLCGAQGLSVGAKKFAESNVLAEIARRVLAKRGMSATVKSDLGSTGILWGALTSGGISCYPEYTGTVGEEILKTKQEMTAAQLRAGLAKFGVGMTDDLGFNDTYALVMRKATADKLNIHSISDLKQHPDLRVAVTHEFLGRHDGWTPLMARYGATMRDVRGIDHALGYQALRSDQIDLTDAYSTDAEIAECGLVALQDDLQFFPKYHAVYLYRLDIPKTAVDALSTVCGTIDEAKMIRMNAEAKRTKNYVEAASLYFGDKATGKAPVVKSDLPQLIGQHLYLVGVSLLAAIIVGIPLGIVASRGGALGQIILGVVGMIQTIPSLALLALLVPIKHFGISATTAIVALFLYSLLPIVRNTATGLMEISLPIRESAAALGLEPFARLTKIYLPMASRTILAGVKTSAIINVGTATLAALIGAGGLGEPIIKGLSLNDTPTILHGAVPAAVLALAVQLLFDLLDRLIIPRGLRLRSPGAEGRTA